MPALHERADALAEAHARRFAPRRRRPISTRRAKAFRPTTDAWSYAEIIRFGPITEQNRLERMLFWPDRKGIGLKQVQATLAAKDATAADPAQLPAKSVAMQGLGALEFVLFGTGAEALATAGDPYRCRYGAAIAGQYRDDRRRCRRGLGQGRRLRRAMGAIRGPATRSTRPAPRR